MASWLAKWHVRPLPSGASSATDVSRSEGWEATSETRFVPASWLVLLLGIAWTALTRGKIAKLGLAGLIWSVAPRPLKIVAAGVVLSWILVVAGALAAIALLALEIN